MQIFNIPDNVVAGVAAEIHAKTNKDYKISIVGVPENLETPQVFEIMQFDEIDAQSFRIRNPRLLGGRERRRPIDGLCLEDGGQSDEPASK